MWQIENLDNKRVKINGNLLKIDSIENVDFCTYHCKCIDEYGEKDFYFKFDETYLESSTPDDSLLATTRTSVIHKVYQKTTNPIILQKVINPNDVTIDFEFIANSNEIKLKCKTSLSKFLFFKQIMINVNVIYICYEFALINNFGMRLNYLNF